MHSHISSEYEIAPLPICAIQLALNLIEIMFSFEFVVVFIFLFSKQNEDVFTASARDRWRMDFLSQLGHNDELHQGHMYTKPSGEAASQGFSSETKRPHTSYSNSNGHSVSCKFCIGVE